MTAFLGVPVGIAGFVTTAVLIFDMVTDPLVGYLSDRTKSRFGRRAPWMFTGVVVMSAGMVGLFAVPPGMGMTANLGWVVAFFVLATIGFTMVAIPYSAQSGEITQSPTERSTMTGFRMAFASIGILIGGAVIPGLAEGRGYATAALMVTPLMVGAVWISLWATRKAPRIEQPATVPLKEVFGLVFSNRPFVVLVLLYGVMTLAVAMITAGLPFAALYLINDKGDTPLSGAAEALSVLSLMFAAFVVGSILSQAVWVVMSHRLGKVAALVIGLFLYIGLLYALYTALPSVNVTVIAGMLLLGGMTNGSYQQIPWALYPDLMDVTRRQSGVAIEGAFSAIWLFGQKLANAMAPALLGLMLAAAGWQETVEGVVDQSEGALMTLQLAITLIPACILVVAALGLWLIYRPMANRILV
ncbi:MAG: MFS transporter [Pseudomonadota bacterium]